MIYLLTATGLPHNKLHKSTKTKLVWPFTSNARRKNGKKSIQVETDVKKATRETKEQMGRLHKE
jgi:predicted GIY-YIG superfamily endonuclease